MNKHTPAVRRQTIGEYEMAYRKNGRVNKMTTKTNEIVVLEVGARGAKVAVNGENKWIDWDVLRAAAGQRDAALADVYRTVLRRAAAMAADGPVIVSVGRDETNVWWSAGVSAAWGGGQANYGRRADEGGTHPNQMLAASEAADICDRLGDRVIGRRGFDGAAARQQIAKIMAR